MIAIGSQIGGRTWNCGQVGFAGASCTRGHLEAGGGEGVAQVLA